MAISTEVLQQIKQALFDSLQTVESSVVDCFEFDDQARGNEAIALLSQVKHTLIVLQASSVAALSETLQMGIEQAILANEPKNYVEFATAFLVLKQQIACLSTTPEKDAQIAWTPGTLFTDEQLVYALPTEHEESLAALVEQLESFADAPVEPDFWQKLGKTSHTIKKYVQTKESYDFFWLLQQLAASSLKNQGSEIIAEKVLQECIMDASDYLSEAIEEGESATLYENLYSALSSLRHALNLNPAEQERKSGYEPPSAQLIVAVDQTAPLFPVSEETLEAIAFAIKKELAIVQQSFEANLSGGNHSLEHVKLAKQIIKDEFRLTKAIFQLLEFSAGQVGFAQLEVLLTDEKQKPADFIKQFCQQFAFLEDTLILLQNKKLSGHLAEKIPPSETVTYSQQIILHGSMTANADIVYRYFKQACEQVMTHLDALSKIDFMALAAEVHQIKGVMSILNETSLVQLLGDLESVYLFLCKVPNNIQKKAVIPRYLDTLTLYEVLSKELITEWAVEDSVLQLLQRAQQHFIQSVDFDKTNMATPAYEGYQVISPSVFSDAIGSPDADITQSESDDLVEDELLNESEPADESEALSDASELSAFEAKESEPLDTDKPAGGVGKSIPEFIPSPRESSEIDSEFLEIFLAEAQEVTESLLAAVPSVQAGELDEPLLSDMRRYFHTLKGSGRMVGLSALGDFAEQHEFLLKELLSGERSIDEAVQEQLVNGIELATTVAHSSPFVEDVDALLASAAATHAIRHSEGDDAESTDERASLSGDATAATAIDSGLAAAGTTNLSGSAGAAAESTPTAEKAIESGSAASGLSPASAKGKGLLGMLAEHPALDDSISVEEKAVEREPEGISEATDKLTESLPPDIGETISEETATVSGATAQAATDEEVDSQTTNLQTQLTKLREMIATEKPLDMAEEEATLAGRVEQVKSTLDKDRTPEWAWKLLNNLKGLIESKEDDLPFKATVQEQINEALDVISNAEQADIKAAKQINRNLMSLRAESLAANMLSSSAISQAMRQQDELKEKGGSPADSKSAETRTAPQEQVVPSGESVELSGNKDNLSQAVTPEMAIEPTLASLGTASSAEQTKHSDIEAVSVVGSAASSGVEVQNEAVSSVVAPVAVKLSPQNEEAKVGLEQSIGLTDLEKAVADLSLSATASNEKLDNQLTKLKDMIAVDKPIDIAEQDNSLAEHIHQVEAALGEQATPAWTWELLANLENLIASKEEELPFKAAVKEKIHQALDAISNFGQVEDQVAKKINSSLMKLQAESLADNRLSSEALKQAMSLSKETVASPAQAAESIVQEHDDKSIEMPVAAASEELAITTDDEATVKGTVDAVKDVGQVPVESELSIGVEADLGAESIATEEAVASPAHAAESTVQEHDDKSIEMPVAAVSEELAITTDDEATVKGAVDAVKDVGQVPVESELSTGVEADLGAESIATEEAGGRQSQIAASVVEEAAELQAKSAHSGSALAADKKQKASSTLSEDAEAHTGIVDAESSNKSEKQAALEEITLSTEGSTDKESASSLTTSGGVGDLDAETAKFSDGRVDATEQSQVSQAPAEEVIKRQTGLADSSGKAGSQLEKTSLSVGDKLDVAKPTSAAANVGRDSAIEAGETDFMTVAASDLDLDAIVSKSIENIELSDKLTIGSVSDGSVSEKGTLQDNAPQASLSEPGQAEELTHKKETAGREIDSLSAEVSDKLSDKLVKPLVSAISTGLAETESQAADITASSSLKTSHADSITDTVIGSQDTLEDLDKKLDLDAAASLKPSSVTSIGEQAALAGKAASLQAKTVKDALAFLTDNAVNVSLDAKTSEALINSGKAEISNKPVEPLSSTDDLDKAVNIDADLVAADNKAVGERVEALDFSSDEALTEFDSATGSAANAVNDIAAGTAQASAAQPSQRSSEESLQVEAEQKTANEFVDKESIVLDAETTADNEKDSVDSQAGAVGKTAGSQAKTVKEALAFLANQQETISPDLDLATSTQSTHTTEKVAEQADGDDKAVETLAEAFSSDDAMTELGSARGVVEADATVGVEKTDGVQLPQSSPEVARQLSTGESSERPVIEGDIILAEDIADSQSKSAGDSAKVSGTLAVSAEPATEQHTAGTGAVLGAGSPIQILGVPLVSSVDVYNLFVGGEAVGSVATTEKVLSDSSVRGNITNLASPAELQEASSRDTGLDLAFSEPAKSDSDILAIFLEEAKDIISRNSESLVEWRADADNLSAIQEIQRGMHTLKGGAGMADFSVLGTLAHDIESLLDGVAQGRIANKEKAGQLLKEGLAASTQMVNVAAENQRVYEDPQYTASLNEFMVEETGTELDSVKDKEKQSAAKELVSDSPKEADLAEAIQREKQQDDYLLRVKTKVVNRLSRLVGDDIIMRAQIERVLEEHDFQIIELSRTVQRVSEQLKDLEAEAESQLLSDYQSNNENKASRDGLFDALEMDHFSEFQQLSHLLSESMEDLHSIHQSLQLSAQEMKQRLIDQAQVQRGMQSTTLSMTLVRFDSITSRLERMMEQILEDSDKKVGLKIVGGDIGVERQMLEEMVVRFEHAIRNAIAHGIESPKRRKKLNKPAQGTVTLTARREGTETVFVIADDGRGFNFDSIRKKAESLGWGTPEELADRNYLLQLPFSSGFTTMASAGKIAGRGIGLDVLYNAISARRGSLLAESSQDEGLVLTIRLPFLMSITDALTVKVGQYKYAIPVTTIKGVGRLNPSVYSQFLSGETCYYNYGGDQYKIESLIDFMDPQAEPESSILGMPVLLVSVDGVSIAFIVESLEQRQELVINAVNYAFSALPGIIGAALLDDGVPVPVMEMSLLARHFLAVKESKDDISQQLQQIEKEVVQEKLKVLVVDDSITMRKMTTKLLLNYHCEVETAKDGLDAVNVLVDWIPDLILLDVEMPRMDGFELARHVRNLPALNQIPIIMITSRTGEKHRTRAEEIGVNGYLGKPYTKEVLVDAIETVLAASMPIKHS